MDALDIITNLDNVVPFFQPIFSADEHRVIGYEILGRYKNDDQYISLGPFFLDETVPEEYRLDVDNNVLDKALQLALELEDDVLLFINRDIDLLLQGDQDELLELLQRYEKQGINLHRIVIEISEQNSRGDVEQIGHLINYYRTYGIKFAYDKLAVESSHLDRIGQISPNILKIDLQGLLSNNFGVEFQDVIYSYSMLARKIGATLLYENIEMVYQLQYAWKNGGRYYQGYYLHKPDISFVNRDILKEQLREEFHHFVMLEKKKLEALYEITQNFQTKITELLHKYRKHADYETLLLSLAREMDHIAFRMYVCDEDGFQKSANIFKGENGWDAQEKYLHRNWSWRPYFLENILKMQKEKKGILSDMYTDIETDENIRTFSFPLNGKDYLFIDLSYEFLYEHTVLM